MRKREYKGFILKLFLTSSYSFKSYPYVLEVSTLKKKRTKGSEKTVPSSLSSKKYGYGNLPIFVGFFTSFLRSFEKFYSLEAASNFNYFFDSF